MTKIHLLPKAQKRCKSYQISQAEVHTNRGHQVAVATKFCTEAPNVCGTSEWNLLHVALLSPRGKKWLLDFSKISANLK